MIAALDMDSVTLEPSYRPLVIIAKQDSTSAFQDDQRVAVARKSYRTTNPYKMGENVTLTDFRFQLFDPKLAMTQELGEKAERAHADMRAYRLRIEALRVEASEDGYVLSASSERDFWRFIRSEPFMRKGNVVLMDNGNLRAVWKGEDGTHVGLQFLGGSLVQYVIFKRRAAVGAISRVAGRDSIDGVKRQIAAFELRPVIYA